MKLLRGLLVLAPTALGCRVYDEALLTRRDAVVAESDVVDAAADVSDVTASDRADVAMPPTDAGIDATLDVAVDLGADVVNVDLVAADVVDVVDAVDAADVRDVVDVPPSCEPTLASGSPCIEPLTGHAWTDDDPRLLAPRAVAHNGSRVLVADVGTGRVLAFDPAAPARAPVVLAGNGIVGRTPATGAPTAAPLGEIIAMAALPNGVLAFADALSRQVLRVAGGRVEALPMLSFQTAPMGLAWSGDTGELFVSGDNRIFSVALGADGGVGAPEALAGLPCGNNCAVAFNGDGLPGTSTAVAGPAGLDVDAEFVYFADRDNCRVRRFRRRDPDRVVTTVAGSVCDGVSDPFVGLGVFAQPTQLRLGRVTDVKLGAEGSIYFIDSSRCAVFGITPPRVMGGDAVPRVVAGSPAGCGRAPMSGPALGPLGGLAVTADRSAVLFVETQRGRVGRIVGTANGGTPVVDFVVPSPASGLDTAAATRVGSPRAIAVGGGAFYVGASAEGRLYRFGTGQLLRVAGDGVEIPAEDATSVSFTAFPPTAFEGASVALGRTLIGAPELGTILEVVDPNLRRVAGRFPSALVARTPLDGGVTDAGLRDASTDVRDGGDVIDATPDAGPLSPLETRFERAMAPLATAAGILFGDGRGRLWRAPAAGAAELVAGTGSVTMGSVPASGTGVPATNAAIGSVAGVAVDANGRIFVADRARHVVWSIGLETPPRARIVAGIVDREAPLSDVSAFGPEFILGTPTALAFDGRQTVYIADESANRVRALDVLTGQVTNVAGTGSDPSPAPGGDFGPARAATLSRPAALAFDSNRLYVAEAGSGRVRVIRLPTR